MLFGILKIPAGSLPGRHFMEKNCIMMHYFRTCSRNDTSFLQRRGSTCYCKVSTVISISIGVDVVDMLSFVIFSIMQTVTNMSQT